jgi:UrcA family protein
MPRNTTGLLLAVATSCLLATTVSAAPPPEAHTARVGYADLNLTTDAGVEALYVRLRHAAERVCDAVDWLDIRGLSTYRDCTERALTHAVASVNNTRLTARHTHVPVALQEVASR